jgi:hypothetical protein
MKKSKTTKYQKKYKDTYKDYKEYEDKDFYNTVRVKKRPEEPFITKSQTQNFKSIKESSFQSPSIHKKQFNENSSAKDQIIVQKKDLTLQSPRNQDFYNKYDDVFSNNSYNPSIYSQQQTEAKFKTNKFNLVRSNDQMEKPIFSPLRSPFKADLNTSDYNIELQPTFRSFNNREICVKNMSTRLNINSKNYIPSSRKDNKSQKSQKSALTDSQDERVAKVMTSEEKIISFLNSEEIYDHPKKTDGEGYNINRVYSNMVSKFI